MSLCGASGLNLHLGQQGLNSAIGNQPKLRQRPYVWSLVSPTLGSRGVDDGCNDRGAIAAPPSVHQQEVDTLQQAQ